MAAISFLSIALLQLGENSRLQGPGRSQSLLVRKSLTGRWLAAQNYFASSRLASRESSVRVLGPAAPRSICDLDDTKRFVYRKLSKVTG
jgi:hypothetical protein